MMRGPFLAMVMLPGAALAQDVAPERVDEFLKVMAESGCRMGEAKSREVLPEAGFGDKGEVKAIAGFLITEERAVMIDGQLIVHAGSCGGAAPDYTTRERFLAAVAYNGCSMTVADSNELLPPLGVERNAIKPLIGQMISMGEVALSQDNQKIFMEQSLCDKFTGMAEKIAGPAMAEARLALEIKERGQADDKTEFLMLMNSVGCKVTYMGFLDVVSDHGLDFDKMNTAYMEFFDLGIVTENEAGDGFFMKPDHCG
jgi:hypothetical protein